MKPNSKKKKALKTAIHFDEENRKDYLTGFQKRKKERREKALKKAEEEIKEEKKKIKDQYRENQRKLLGVTPEIMASAARLVNKSIKDTATHSVSIEEYDLTGSHYYLGTNPVAVPSNGDKEGEGDMDLEEQEAAAVPEKSKKNSLKKALKMRPLKKKRGIRAGKGKVKKHGAKKGKKGKKK